MSSPDTPNSGRLKLLLVGVFVVAVTLTVVGTLLAGDNQSDVAVDVAKAGIQLGVIGLLTTAVTQSLKRFNDQRDERMKQADMEREQREKQANADREEERRLNDYRLTVFRNFIDAYNRIKTVRRTLRATGLSAPLSGSLKSWQLDEFNAQMRALNEAELSLEKIEHEVVAREDLFPHAKNETPALLESQKYLRKVLNAWEKRALCGTNLDVDKTKSIVRLEDFVAKRKDRNITDFWPYFTKFEDAIRADMACGPPARAEGAPGTGSVRLSADR